MRNLLTAIAFLAAAASLQATSHAASTHLSTDLYGERVVASWFNPRTGEFTDKKRHAFEPRGDGDRVLVLDGSMR